MGHRSPFSFEKNVFSFFLVFGMMIDIDKLASDTFSHTPSIPIKEVVLDKVYVKH